MLTSRWRPNFNPIKHSPLINHLQGELAHNHHRSIINTLRRSHSNQTPPDSYLLGSTSNTHQPIPPQSQTKSTHKFARFIHKPAPPRIPKPHHGIETVEKFLESLKRPSLVALSEKFKDWDELFKINEIKRDLIKDGTLSVPRERRYLLRCLELFRQGLDPKDFSVPEKKPKKIRGWGPRVQHGKRLRGKPGGRVTI